MRFGGAGTGKNREIFLKKATKRDKGYRADCFWIELVWFLGIQLLLYLGFLAIDWAGQRAAIPGEWNGLSNQLKYLSVVLCFLWRWGRKEPNLWAAQLFVLAADYFLLFTGKYGAGVLCFLGVQFCYGNYLKKKSFPFTIFWIAFVVLIGTAALEGTWTLIFQVKGELIEKVRTLILQARKEKIAGILADQPGLYGVCIFYAGMLLRNIGKAAVLPGTIRKAGEWQRITEKAEAWRQNVGNIGETHQIPGSAEFFCIGLFLLLLCDIHVALYNLPEFSHRFWRTWQGISQMAMWFFYLPSQVLITLAAAELTNHENTNHENRNHEKEEGLRTKGENK